ncbi:MAG: HAD family hydrolase [Bacteroidota bacterium]|jgi:2-haloacid dehalogenase
MLQTIIYDLGGVLIDWNPMYVYENYFDTKEDLDFFFAHICTAEWNEEQDGGRTIEEANLRLITEYPEWEKAIKDYYGRWPEMIKGSIKESVNLLSGIKASNHFKLYALTNWSAETFPLAKERFEFLSWFDGILVSGEEKTRKPFDDFYMKLLTKYGIEKNTTVFIDDNLRNVEAARKLGIPSIHFKETASLHHELKKIDSRFNDIMI